MLDNILGNAFTDDDGLIEDSFLEYISRESSLDTITLVAVTPKNTLNINKHHICEKCGIHSANLVDVYHRIESQRIRQDTVIELCKNCAILANHGEWDINTIKVLNYNSKREKKYQPKDFIRVLSTEPKQTTVIQRIVGCDFDVAHRWLTKLAETNIIIETNLGWMLKTH